MSNTITPALQEIDKLTERWEANFRSIDKIAVDIATKMAKIAKTDSGGLASSEVTARLKANAEAVKLLNEQLEKQKQINKQLQDSLNKLIQKRAKNNTRTTEEIENQKILARNARISAKANSTLASAYDRASAKLIQLRNSYKNLATQQQLGIKLTDKQEKEMKQLRLEANRLDGALKKVDKAVGQNQRSVGNYGLALKNLGRSLLSAVGFTGGIFALVSVLKSASETVKEFDQSQADLAAITGKSREEISELTDQALKLGSTTAFTATQVAKLQLELSKLGFDTDQILSATEGVENLAIATGVDAARAAKLAGASIRGFNLESSEANRVAAALAVSTTKSASSFETLEVALPKVSAIANAFGFTIEDTTALLGGLQNAGFEASIAGTSLRQIFLQLADENGKLAQRLGGGAKNFDELIDQFKKAETEGISLSEAFGLTNARSVAAFKVFLSGAEDMRTLRNEITGVEDELSQLAETKLDSIQGEITLLNSAWEGFVLSLEDGDNTLGKLTRGSLAQITKNIGKFNIVLDENISFFDRWKVAVNGYSETFRKFLPFISEGNGLFHESAQAIIDNANGMDRAKNSSDELNSEFVKMYGSLAPLTEEQIKLNTAIEEFSILTNDYGKVDEKAGDYKLTLGEINELIKEQKDQLLGATTRSQAKAIQAEIAELEKKKIAILGNTKASKEQQKALEGSIGKYSELISKLEATRSKTARNSYEWGIQTKVINELKEKLEALKGQFEGVNRLKPLGFDEVVEKTQLQIDAEKELLKAVKDTNSELEKRQQDAEDFAEQNFERQQQELKREQDFREKQLNLASETLGAINDIAYAFSEGTFNRLDEEEDRIEQHYNNLLDNESLSNEARSQLEAERQVELDKLAEKREEAEKRAFLVQQAFALAQIGIDLAKTISAINLAGALINATPAGALSGGALGASYIATNLPFAIGSAAAQTASVLAQTIPAFKDGHLEGTYEGFAKINDEKSPLYREIIARKDGSIDMYKKRDQVAYINKGDKVLPAKMSDGIIQDMKLRGVLDNLNISMSKQSTDSISEQQIERAMSRAFSKQPKNIVNIDKEGMQTYMLSSHTKNIIKNNSVRFK